MREPPDIATRLDVPTEYNLHHTMIGHRMGALDPCLRISEGTVRLALRTPEGPAALEIDEQETSVAVRGWGSGTRWLTPRLDGLLGLRDTPRHFQPSGRVIPSLWRRFSGMHLPKLPRVLDRLVQVILLQRVSRRDGCIAWKRLVLALGEEAPGPLRLVLPPSPERLASTPYYELMGCGVAPRQARTIQQVAFHARRIEDAAEAGSESLRRVLSTIPGVGPWTMGYLCGSALGDPDAILPGDYNLPHTVAWVLAGEARADEERMLELLEPYRGHRYRVIRLIWMNGVHAPRRGPRVTGS